MHDSVNIGVIGLGYVGLPLAVEFGKLFPTVGYDINNARVDELKNNFDKNGETTFDDLVKSKFLSFSSDEQRLATCNVYIVTVPTPIDADKHPDLGPLQAASRLIGQYLKYGDTVIYESTVYPGVTEEECVPILTDTSGLIYNKDFFCGYSPERINPGDKSRGLSSIVKVTSGSNTETLNFIDGLYSKIISAGTFRAESIKVAEASKVIENIQRDVNIALINELSMIFNQMNISIYDVLKAAGTKWNFLKMQPGLVGGHCISIDPYYLAYKSTQLNFSPDIILASRKINENMSRYAAGILIKKMIQKKINVGQSRVLMLGLTFKEDCPDLRNTKVVDLISELEEYGAEVDVFDPVADQEEARDLVCDRLTEKPLDKNYDAAVIAVPHAIFIEQGIESVWQYCRDTRVIFDLKACLKNSDVDLTF